MFENVTAGKQTWGTISWTRCLIIPFSFALPNPSPAILPLFLAFSFLGFFFSSWLFFSQTTNHLSCSSPEIKLNLKYEQMVTTTQTQRSQWGIKWKRQANAMSAVLRAGSRKNTTRKLAHCHTWSLSSHICYKSAPSSFSLYSIGVTSHCLPLHHHRILGCDLALPRSAETLPLFCVFNGRWFSSALLSYKTSGRLLSSAADAQYLRTVTNLWPLSLSKVYNQEKIQLWSASIMCAMKTETWSSKETFEGHVAFKSLNILKLKQFKSL